MIKSIYTVDPLRCFYRGESRCVSPGCPLKAGYIILGRPFCGTHSRRKARLVMHKNPETARLAIVERAAQEEKIEADRHGLIRFAEYGGHVFEKLPTLPGFITIDLMHARSSSKRRCMFTGARFLPEESGVIERRFLVKYAADLHTLWYANVVCTGNIASDGATLKPEFYAAREAYLTSGRNSVIDGDDDKFEFWLWLNEVSAGGGEMRLSRRQARVLFCQMYFDLFRERLRSLVLLHVENGYNLLLAGRTATPDVDVGDGDSLLDALVDTSRPFSFELVIGCMMRFATAAAKPNNVYPYPWSREYEQLLLEMKRCSEAASSGGDAGVTNQPESLQCQSSTAESSPCVLSACSTHR